MRHVRAIVVDHLGPVEQNQSSLQSRGVGCRQLVKMVSPLAPLPRVDLLPSEEAHLLLAIPVAQVGGRERNQDSQLFLPPALIVMTMMMLTMI